jgi:hypothetical protein
MISSLRADVHARKLEYGCAISVPDSQSSPPMKASQVSNSQAHWLDGFFPCAYRTMTKIPKTHDDRSRSSKITVNEWCVLTLQLVFSREDFK